MENGKQNTTKVDLIVVGAGPAGCAAAIWGAQNGLTVTLLESHAFDQDKPGESLHPGIFPLLKLLCVDHEVKEANFLRYSGQCVSWGTRSEFQAFGSDINGPWLGIHVIRSKFESILRNRASCAGVNVRQSCKAISPVFDNGRIVGVNTQSGIIMSKYVVDASGSRHWLSLQNKLTINYLSPQLIAYYGYTKSGLLDLEMGAFLEIDKMGWTWVARVDNDHFAWTSVAFDKPNKKNKVPHRLTDCTPIGSIKGADVTWRTVPLSAGLGYFIAGDAAGVFDPLSSDGVIRAIMTGIKASYLAHSIIVNKEHEITTIKYYQHWCQDIFDREAQKLQGLYDEMLYKNQIKTGSSLFKYSNINFKTTSK